MARAGTTSLAVIAAGGGALVLAVVIAVVVAVRACSPDAPRTAVPTESNGARVADEGMRARGTDELRQLGCDHALVVDMARLLGDAAGVREGEPRLMVTCDVAAATSPPTCERVAAAYFGAIGGNAQDRVGVRVTREGSPTPACSRLYAPNGADLGPFGR